MKVYRSLISGRLMQEKELNVDVECIFSFSDQMKCTFSSSQVPDTLNREYSDAFKLADAPNLVFNHPRVNLPKVGNAFSADYPVSVSISILRSSSSVLTFNKFVIYNLKLGFR